MYTVTCIVILGLGIVTRSLLAGGAEGWALQQVASQIISE